MECRTLESRMIGNGHVRFGEGWLEKGLDTKRYLVSHLLYIVWDAVEVAGWSRKHTGNVGEGLERIRSITEELLQKRDERKDGFSEAIRKAMQTRLGRDSEECLKALSQRGIKRTLAKKALEVAAEQGGFSIWCVVDALTRLARETQFAGLRTEADGKASQLLQLAS